MTVDAAGVVHRGAVLQLLLLRADVVVIVRLALVLGVVGAQTEQLALESTQYTR